MKRKLASFSFRLTAVLMMVAIFATGLPVFGAVAMTAMSVMATGGVNAGLNKEIWLPEILEDFFANDMFLSEFRNMDAFVDNNTINLAEAGVIPEVLINNTTYPIPYAQRVDSPIALPLDTFDTENTLVQNIEAAELAYDKMKSVVYGHKQSLKMTFMQKAAHAVAPTSDTEYTPLLETTGPDDGTGRKRLIFKDISKLKKRFNNAEIPTEGRILILSATHQEDLEIEDVDRFNKIMDKGMLIGFKLYDLAEKRLPRYSNLTGVKVAYGAISSPTDAFASIAFQKDEVMRAKGTEDMFAKEKDPELRGDMIGFQMRGIALPIRNRGIAAIYSAAV